MIIDEIRNIKSGKKDLKKFGLTMGTVLGAIAIVLLIKRSDNTLIITIIAGLCLLLGLVAPILLKPLQKVWMTLAILMGWLMTRVILTITYYVIFTPIGMISRLFGKDFLEKKWKKDANGTYWIKKTSSFEKTKYENQF